MDFWVVIDNSYGITSFDREPIAETESFSMQKVVDMSTSCETAGHNEIAFTQRPKPLLPSMWERHRAVITGLYVEQGMILRDIKVFMAERHGFEAR